MALRHRFGELHARGVKQPVRKPQSHFMSISIGISTGNGSPPRAHAPDACATETRVA
jgi:hypothetical protein